MANTLAILGVFTSSWMLLWATAAGIPIVLHLLARRDRQQMDWAATRFLIVAVKQAARRFQLWRWFLLLLRMMALILLALALADPRIQATSSPLVPRVPTLHIVVMDTSMSMQAREDGTTRWEKAVEQATILCDSAGEGDGFLVFLMGANPAPLFDDISYDNHAVGGAIASANAEDTAADVQETWRQIEEKLDSVERSGQWQDAVKITFISDMQATTWRQSTMDSAGLPMNPATEIISISAESDLPNLFVRSLSASRQVLSADRTITVHSVVENSKSGNEDQVLVQLMIDDITQESRRVKVTPGNRVPVDWTVATSWGKHVLKVRIATDDALAHDNQRICTIDLPESFRILCTGRDSRATRFIATALGTSPDSAVRVSEHIGKRLQPSDLAGVDLIVLCDQDRLSRSEHETLKNHCASGGNLLIWLADDCDVESFNALLNDDSEQGIRMASITQASEFGQYQVDPASYLHPIAQAFQQFPNSGLTTTPVFRFWKLTIPKDANVEQVLRVGDNFPLLAMQRRPSGGCVAVVATPLSSPEDAPWNGIAVWPSFIPLVYESIAYMHADPTAIDAVAGQPHRVRLDIVDTQDDLYIAGADGSQQSVDRRDSSESVLLPAIPLAGLFEIKKADNMLRRFAVNPPVEESNLSQLEANRMSRVIQADERLSASGTHTEAATPNAKDTPLFAVLLALVICCVLIESISTRFLRSRFA